MSHGSHIVRIRSICNPRTGAGETQPYYLRCGVGLIGAWSRGLEQDHPDALPRTGTVVSVHRHPDDQARVVACLAECRSPAAGVHIAAARPDLDHRPAVSGGAEYLAEDGVRACAGAGAPRNGCALRTCPTIRAQLRCPANWRPGSRRQGCRGPVVDDQAIAAALAATISNISPRGLATAGEFVGDESVATSFARRRRSARPTASRGS